MPGDVPDDAPDEVTAPRGPRLVPDDEELVALARQAEDVLLALAVAEESSADEPEPWVLPAPIARREALNALYRVWEPLESVVDAFHTTQQDRPAGARLLGPDGRYEHTPLRVAELDQADLDILAAALGAFNRALTPARSPTPAGAKTQQLSDLATVLDDLSVDLTRWPQGAEPTSANELLRPLARLTAVLDIASDADTTLLLDVLRHHPDRADIVLTPDQEAAYQRAVARLNLLLTDADPLHRWLH